MAGSSSKKTDAAAKHLRNKPLTARRCSHIKSTIVVISNNLLYLEQCEYYRSIRERMPALQSLCVEATEIIQLFSMPPIDGLKTSFICSHVGFLS